MLVTITIALAADMGRFAATLREATFAADGLDGQLRYDPMSMRPFMSYPEGLYARHWLEVIGAAKEQPIFAHVNWFQRDLEDGHFLWPGYRENLRLIREREPHFVAIAGDLVESGMAVLLIWHR